MYSEDDTDSHMSGDSLDSESGDVTSDTDSESFEAVGMLSFIKYQLDTKIVVFKATIAEGCLSAVCNNSCQILPVT